ncbi:hypothetical protein A0H81_01208 [Grifola frondosa]|uniref:Uncharacterized protein n=1 Tax=Grifola frondosa TaxID=5627 RepID=A0A1C7MRF5_GRIFR|nr:hypothetical protein A0H81_01208 [Grifola frondosa]
MKASSSTPDLQELTPVFFGLHLVGGQIGLPIVVCIFLLSKDVRRHTTIINFCITWIIYSVAYCLSIYGKFNAPAMPVVAGLAVVFQVWCTFREPWMPSRFDIAPQVIWNIAMIAPPYLVFLAFSLAATYMAIEYPNSISMENGLYCDLDGTMMYNSVPIFCTVVMIFILGFEVAILVTYCRSRLLIKKVCPLAETKMPSLIPWMRVTIFLLYSCFAFGACASKFTNDLSSFPYMIQATLPFGVLLVFGTHKDVVLAWRFWDRKQSGYFDTSTAISSRNTSIERRPSAFSIGASLPGSMVSDGTTVPRGEMESRV